MSLDDPQRSRFELEMKRGILGISAALSELSVQMRTIVEDIQQTKKAVVDLSNAYNDFKAEQRQANGKISTLESQTTVLEMEFEEGFKRLLARFDQHFENLVRTLKAPADQQPGHERQETASAG